MLTSKELRKYTERLLRIITKTLNIRSKRKATPCSWVELRDIQSLVSYVLTFVKVSYQISKNNYKMVGDSLWLTQETITQESRKRIY